MGAGAVGCSIAYHLAKRGQRGVVVLERGGIGAGSTSKAAGGVRAQFATETEIRFSLLGIDFFKRFRDEMGVECGYVQDGYLFVVSDESMLERCCRNVELQNGYGVPSRVIGPADVREIAPSMNLDDVVAGVWCPIDGHATPNDVCMAYAARARGLGVAFHEETAVTSMRALGGGRTEVSTTDGTITAPVVINAAGPNARWVARMLGMDAPVTPKRRHIFVTDAMPEIARRIPLTIDLTSGFYCRSEGETVLLSPGDAQPMPNADEPAVDWSALEPTVAKAFHRFPILERASVRTGWAGLRPITPDDHAIIDWMPGVEGVFLAVGFAGHGFQHSPATGQMVAEWLLDGQPSLDLSMFSASRFRPEDDVAGKNSLLSGLV